MSLWHAVRVPSGIYITHPASDGSRLATVVGGTDADAEALACELVAMLPPDRHAAVARELAAAEGLRVLTAGHRIADAARAWVRAHAAFLAQQERSEDGDADGSGWDDAVNGVLRAEADLREAVGEGWPDA